MGRKSREKKNRRRVRPMPTTLAGKAAVICQLTQALMEQKEREMFNEWAACECEVCRKSKKTMMGGGLDGVV